MQDFETSLGRRDFITTLLAGAGVLATGRAFAAADPLGLPAGRNVTIVVPFTPGTTPDLAARMFSPVLGQTTGHPFVVDNRAGASGIIGLQMVANAAPDGMTIASSTNTALTLPLVYAKVPFDVIESFTPLAMIGSLNFGLCVHPSLKVNTVQQFIDYVKKNPGKVNYGSPGKGTFHHLCMEMFIQATGLNMVHVPYKGSAGALTDLLGGQIQAMFQPMHIAAPLAQDKRLVILGTTQRDQDPLHPQYSPLIKLGVKDFDATSWYAFLGPKGMKPELVSAYNTLLNNTMTDAKIKADLAKNGVAPMPMTSPALGALMKDEYAKWAKVAKGANILPE